MIKFKCDFCDQRLGVPDDFVGKRVRCTKCRAINIVLSAQERLAKESARAAAALPTAIKATLPTIEPVRPAKVALHSSLLDLSSNSGSFAGELPAPSKDDVSESDIFGNPKPLPAFGAELPHLSLEEPGELDDSVVGLADTGGTLPTVHVNNPFAEEELSFDDPPPKAHPPQAAKPQPKPPETKKPGKDEDFGLGLLEPDPTDSNPGKVDLDGLGF